MKRHYPNLAFVIIAPLVLLALAAVTFALWLVDHRSALRYSGIILAVIMGIFFVSFLTAFLLHCVGETDRVLCMQIELHPQNCPDRNWRELSMG